MGVGAQIGRTRPAWLARRSYSERLKLSVARALRARRAAPGLRVEELPFDLSARVVALARYRALRAGR